MNCMVVVFWPQTTKVTNYLTILYRLYYSATSITWTPLATAFMLAYWISEIVWITEVFLPDIWCLVIKRYLRSIITVNSIHITTQVSQFWPRQVSATSIALWSTAATPPKGYQTRLLRMRINVFSWVERVRIIEVPDHQGSTVHMEHQQSIQSAIILVNITNFLLNYVTIKGKCDT